ncbi:YdcF family protein [Parashewanella spongiae]|uniref:YdcF family protein n=3 Tax=Parashewanella spongiae TaxID=342950 RepID=A0A3A6UCD6_9GAMM|nr:ElyC/SanA/YdcF family protein [Parashewanella spongiae]RJY16390.1 YdcF family protein [Parashewanella spongiae]
MFWLKKIISQFFMPLPLVVLILLSTWLWIRHRRFARASIATTILMIMILASPISNWLFVNPLESQYSANNAPMKSKCTVLILGSGHNDMTDLSATQQLSSTALARLVEGVRQFKLSQNCRFVVSGWNDGSHLRSHAEVMAEAAVELGIPSDRIDKMPLAKDTDEEAVYLKQLQGGAPFRLVTSATHMPRAIAIFKQRGLVPEPAPTDFINSPSKWWRLEAKQLNASQRAIHEYLGLAWFHIKSVLKASSD